MVRVDAKAWRQALGQRQDWADEPLLARWADRGWPLIVRAAACEDPEGRLPLGVPLPPSPRGKRRIALNLDPSAVLTTTPPPTLADAALSAPSAWRDMIAAILELEPRTRCYGSLAWQHLTELAYLTPASDLDLLWPVADARRADQLGGLLSVIAGAGPARLDGEFVGPNGSAVHWREWASGASELLVKTDGGPRLSSRADSLT